MDAPLSYPCDALTFFRAMARYSPTFFTARYYKPVVMWQKKFHLLSHEVLFLPLLHLFARRVLQVAWAANKPGSRLPPSRGRAVFRVVPLIDRFLGRPSSPVVFLPGYWKYLAFWACDEVSERVSYRGGFLKEKGLASDRNAFICLRL